MPGRNARAFEVAGQRHPYAQRPGAYWFLRRYDFELQKNVEPPIGIGHACPCGCGAQSVMWFKGGSLNGTGEDPSHEWDVTGEWPKVTLSPSIGFAKRADGSFHWHGYLKAGVFEECP